MSFKAKVSGAWKAGQRIFVKIADAWKPVKKLLVKDGGVWKLVYQIAPAVPPIQVWALGKNQTVYSSNGVYMNGTPAAGAGGTYNVARFSNTGALQDVQAYDIDTGAFSAYTRLTSDVNAMAAGQIYAIFSNVDAKTNHTLASVSTAMHALGVTAIYDQVMNYGGAYMAIGKKGSGPIFEQYIGGNFGSSNGDPAAGITAKFSISGGVITML